MSHLMSLLAVKRTCLFALQMSAYDPKRTFETQTAMPGFCYDFIWGMNANARHIMTTRRYCGMINRLWNTFAAAALIAVTLIGADAWGQTSRTIRIVVPFPPGGSADILARLLGEQISKSQGPTVIIENRPGGGASIAYEAVARAAPDGNTLVINANSFVINPHLLKVNYDPLTSYEPICYLLSSPQVIVVNRDAPDRPLP